MLFRPHARSVPQLSAEPTELLAFKVEAPRSTGPISSASSNTGLISSASSNVNAGDGIGERGPFPPLRLKEIPGVRKTGWRIDQRSEGGDVSELRVDPASLETAAGHSDEAAQSSANLSIKDGMEGVSTAMKGGVSGSVAKSAANQVDSISKKMTEGLNAFTESVRAAKDAYVEIDESTKIDFTRFENAFEEKN